MNNVSITPIQIKLIHTLLHALAIDDDVYRGILAVYFHVESSKQLSRAQAEELIGFLKQKAVTAGVWQERPGRKKKFHEWENRRGGMASPAQLRKIEAMWSDVSRIEDPKDRRKGLRSFLERVVKISDLRFLDQDGAGKIINALSAMQKQEKPGKAKKAI